MRKARHKGWYRRGNLPHFDATGICQAITYHLSDSLPTAAMERMKIQLERLPEDERSGHMRKWMQQYLDAGHGRCILREPPAAQCVAETIVRFDRVKYDLIAWVVMPNHVHVLIRPYAEYQLGQIVQAWKNYTSRHIRSLFPDQATSLWFANYWDRYIRDDEHLSRAIAYIRENPVKAGLVTSPEDWPWSGLNPNRNPNRNPEPQFREEQE